MNEGALVGRRCKKLWAREFWRSGRLVDEYCAIFLEDDLGDKWKLYIDDEDNTWKLEQVDEVPMLGQTEGDAEFNYPTTDLFNRFQIKDLVIQRLSEADLGTFARITIFFSNGHALALDYDYMTTRTRAHFT